MLDECLQKLKILTLIIGSFLFFACTKPTSLFESTPYKFPGLTKIEINKSGNLNLFWDKVPASDVVYHVFKREQNESFEWTNPYAVENKSSHIVAQYPFDERYCFAVRFVQSSYSPDLNSVEICPDIPYVSGFVGIKSAVSNGSGGALVTWEAPTTTTGIDGYAIYLGTAFEQLKAIADPSVQSAVITGLDVDSTVTLGVRAIDKYGRTDANKKTVSIKVLNNAPLIFGGIESVVQVGATSAKLTWPTPSGIANEFKIFQASGAANSSPSIQLTTPLTKVAGTLNETIVSGLGDEQAHCFLVRSVSSGSQDDLNTEKKCVNIPDNGAPVFSGIKNFVFEAGVANISWDEAIGETQKYRVYYQEGTSLNFGTATVADVAAPATGTTISGLMDNRNWTFAVRAVDSRNQSDTNVVKRTVYAGDLTPPVFGGYQGIIALDETRLQIEWTKSTDDDMSYYSIQTRIGSNAFSQHMTVTHSGVGTATATLTGLLPATSYDVRVRALDTSGNPSTNTTFLTRATLDLTPPTFNGITSVAPKAGDVSKALVQWNVASDAGGVAEYRVYYSKTSLVGQTLVRTATYPLGAGAATIWMSNAVTSATSLEIPALEEGAVYYFVVHAIDNAGNEDANTAQTAYTVPYYTPPQPPTNLAITGGNGPSTNRSPFITGDSVAGYSVKLYVNGTPNKTQAINATGAFSIQLNQLPNTSANYVVTAAHINQSGVEGNAANVATYNLFIDVPVASLSGAPAALTNTSALNVTVSSANSVTQYKRSLVSNQTTACADATYSPTWVDVATLITDSVSVDGLYRLCVIAKNAAGLEQDPTGATVVNFERNTAPPAPPGTLTLTNPVTNATSETYSPLVNGVVTAVTGATHYCTTPTNVAPATDAACWTASTTTSVTLSATGTVAAYAWSKNGFGTVSTTSTSDTIVYTNICSTGDLATTCTRTGSYTLPFGPGVIGGQGNLVVSAGATFATQAQDSWSIKLGGNLTVQGSLAGNFSVEATNITIMGGALVNADSLGFAGGPSPSGGNGGGPGGGLWTGDPVSGGGHGGMGGYSGSGAGATTAGGSTYGSATSPTTWGSGGASNFYAGGAGGGAVKLAASGTLVQNGSIRARGAQGSGLAGGGAGGSIWLTASVLSGSGSIEVTGGDTGLWGPSGGAGGGGRVAISAATGFFGGAINVRGGLSAGRGSQGSTGTVHVTYTNPCDVGNLATTCTINTTRVWGNGQPFSANNLVIESPGALRGAGPHTAFSIVLTGALTIQSGGVIEANLTNVEATSVTIDAGGVLKADGLGLAVKRLPNVAHAAPGDARDSAGGGHGGDGGWSGARQANHKADFAMPDLQYSGGASHGNPAEPVTYGGGGADGAQSTCVGRGYGGGAIKISTPTLTVNGTLSALGESATTCVGAGGGAGGSLWLNVSSLIGSGSISVNGGNGTTTATKGGGGGGGRIASYHTNKFAGAISANGGSGGGGLATNGQTGSFHFPNNASQYCNTGDLSGTCTISSRWVLSDGFVLNGQTFFVTTTGVIETRHGERASIIGTGDVTIEGTVRGNLTIQGGDVTVASSGLVDASGLGFKGTYASNGLGPGAGTASGATHSAGGGSHGGVGGSGTTAGGFTGVGGAAYGDDQAPVTFGSSGGASYFQSAAMHGISGSGGGALKLIASNVLTIFGTVQSNGLSPVGNGSTATCSGGGAGGSIWMVGNSFLGNGHVIANGGRGDDGGNCATMYFNSGGGGGGRIRIQVSGSDSATLGTLTANGGATIHASAGASGTIVRP